MIENRIEQHVSPAAAQAGQDVEAHAIMAIRTDALLGDCLEAGSVSPQHHAATEQRATDEATHG